MFTDYYAENSCTAGRSSFITGQTPQAHRPLQGRHSRRAGRASGARHHHRAGAQAARLRDRPVRQEPSRRPQRISADGARLRRVLRQPLSPQRRGGAERPYWPKDDKEYVDNNSPRGVLHCKASDTDDPTVQPHWGRVGKQTIEDTGPLTRKRMETIDDETTAAAIDYMGRQVKANKPFFVWMNTTRMHVFTHVRESMRGQSGMPGNEYADGMIEHDNDVGKLLKARRRSRHRQQHHRRLHDRQRPQSVLLARRRDDAVPQREGHQLGRRVPRAGDGALAGPYPARRGLERDVFRARLVPDAACGRWRYRRSRIACSRAPTSAARPSRCISTATTSSITSPARSRRARAPTSPISTMTAISSRIRHENWKAVFEEQKTPGRLRRLVRAAHRLSHSEGLQPADGPV